MIEKIDKLYIVCVLLALFRVWLGNEAGAYYNIQTPHDEVMLFHYSLLPEHFSSTTDVWIMAKNMSFPLFLNFVHFSTLSYTTVLSLVWIAAAFLGMFIFRKINTTPKRGGKVLALLIFCLIAFAPCAFDFPAGTLLYRTAIIAPFALLFFLLLFLFVYKMLGIEDNSLQAPKKPPIILAIALGLLFGFNFYIQESGQWLFVLVLPSLAFALIFSLHKSKKVARKTIALRILCCALPLIIFAGYDLTYRAINEHYFGVFEINTRIGGEQGKFIQNLYKIDSPERTREIWVPNDVLKQAFAASATLSAVPEFYDALETTTWPAAGDMITWAVPDEFRGAGLWKNYAQTEAFFKQVNVELEQAFEDGTLKKAAGLRITATAPARSVAEILALRPLIIQGYKSAIWGDGYIVAKGSDADLEDVENITLDSRGIIADYITNSFLEENYHTGFYAFESRLVYKLENILVGIHKIIGLPLFLLALVGFVFAIRRKALLQIVFMASLLLAATAVLVGIAWFSDFLVSDSADIVARMKYYGVGAVPCILLFNIFGLSSLWNTIPSGLPRRYRSSQ